MSKLSCKKRDVDGLPLANPSNLTPEREPQQWPSIQNNTFWKRTGSCQRG